ncbi:hypothetical protein [Christiangramia crocea]|uniref:Uncharacterized protein n=1 Tax=Christiangramia crocea TaxID=2904124 RepID=A0A9X2A7J3_9FLAO|nr:hypothetical protein [Gramella crocea]MCG9973379.1 hypothetical protein [Gramella crocea]
MKRLIVLLLIMPFLGFSQEEDSRIMHMWELTIKANQGQKFQEGMKKWKDCYLENEGVDSWNVWNRVQGVGNVVAVTLYMDKWAEMDEDNDEAGQTCSSIFQTDVFPYVEKMEHHIATTIPEFSRSQGDRPKLVNVVYFKVNNSPEFTSVVKDVSSTFMESSENAGGFWYDFVGGGPDSPHYMVAAPLNKFADLDENRDGPWQAYEKKHGKAKTESTRNRFRESVDEIWSYMYKLNTELSRDPE